MDIKRRNSSLPTKSESSSQKSKLKLFHGKYLQFKRNLNQVEEEVFVEHFQRKGSYGDVVTLQDIRNLVLFTLKSKVSREFLKFVLSNDFTEFLHATIFYVDYFLTVQELVMVRRNEMKHNKIRDQNSNDTEALISDRLSHRRLLMSREFSKICLNMSAENARKFRMANPSKELRFFGALADFTVECCFVCLRRRAFEAISTEILRLFGGETPNDFNKHEQQILYGRAWCKQTALHGRNTPLLTELVHATKTPSPETDDILKLGVEKYDGCDKYLLELERFFTVCEMHYVLIGEQLGILGHPLEIYEPALNLNMRTFKKMEWTAAYDPYGFIRPIEFVLPRDAIKPKIDLRNPHKFVFRKEKVLENLEDLFNLWRRKDALIDKAIMKREPILVNLD